MPGETTPLTLKRKIFAEGTAMAKGEKNGA
jgi:hypothetical protein